MVHILASLAFSLVAIATLGLIAFMLVQDQDRIMVALGLRVEPVRQTARRAVRVRTAGRWQQVQATSASRPRAAA